MRRNSMPHLQRSLASVVCSVQPQFISGQKVPSAKVLYQSEEGHVWVGEYWYGRPPANAVSTAPLPLVDDPRWQEGVPKITDIEVLTLSPFYPCGRLDVSVEMRRSTPLTRHQNHPPFDGCKAWMPISAILWTAVQDATHISGRR